jgi:hypothetical protein
LRTFFKYSVLLESDTDISFEDVYEMKVLSII